MPNDIAIVILAGGNASRFPNKLEQSIDGEPMVVRVFRAMRATSWPVYVAGKGSFTAEIDARLECPLLVDRWPGSGPLGALLSACGEIAHERVFAVAADEPLVDARLLETLASAWREGDRAVVPEHDGRIEPLAALYATSSVIHEGFTLFGQARSGMHDLIERLSAHRVPVSGSYFANVNTPADLRRLGASLA
jgi:molybdopterin-guanine dinucleotide biosynthesis protein A